MLDENPYKELKNNPFSKMFREFTKIINNSELIIEEERKFKVSNL